MTLTRRPPQHRPTGRASRVVAALLVVLPLVGGMGLPAAAAIGPAERFSGSTNPTLGTPGSPFGTSTTTQPGRSTTGTPSPTVTSPTTTTPPVSATPQPSSSRPTSTPDAPSSSTSGRTPSRTPDPTGSDTPPPASVTDPMAPPDEADAPLTPEQVRAQLAQAETLRSQLAATDVGLGAATQALQLISGQVSAALEQQQVALGEQRAARDEQVRQQQRLRSLRGSLAQSQQTLGRWARSAYAVGGPMAAYESWLTVMEGSSTSDVGHDLALLEQVGVLGSEQVQRLQTAARQQQEAARQSALAAARAEAARQRADTAASQGRELLAQQKVALARLQSERARIVGSDAFAREQRAGLQRVQGALPAVTTGRCAGRSTAGYANGTIPAAALCPLWGAPGQALRADAAAGFERLAQAYAAEFASPLCVTDSYRSLAEQIRVYAEKPTLAAHPGTSNHGWGTALDLCGGIQSFGTVQHAWMLAHAPLYGWFHPAWAEPTGSRPEPWHWEFAG